MTWRDNTCHFGINSMFADGGVKPGHGEDTTRLYFPVGSAPVRRLREAHLRRSRVCASSSRRARRCRTFSTTTASRSTRASPSSPARITWCARRKRPGGYVVAIGEAVYRALDAVITLQESGINVGLDQQADT